MISINTSNFAFYFKVGGTFSTLLSPNDPTFFGHHAMVDFLFEKYLELHGTSVPAGWDDTVPRPYNAAAKIKYTDTFDTKPLCYSYTKPAERYKFYN